MAAILFVAAPLQADTLDVRPPTSGMAALFSSPASQPKEEGCAECYDSISGSGGSYGASWSMNGRSCTGESNCAQCTPTCVGSGSIGGNWEEVSNWYDENNCSNWACTEQDLLEDALAAVESDDATRIALVLEESAGAVRFNAERQAIQVYGCKGQVFEHIEISSAIALLLESELSQRGSR
jgi:hypothetical protein